MKKKKLITAIIGLSLVTGITACPSNNPPVTSGGGDNPPITSTGGDDNNQDEIKIAAYKSQAKSKLDELINAAIAKITDQELKEAVQTYYNTEKKYIEDIKDLETAETALTKVIEDTKAFAKDTLLPLAIKKINELINPLIEKITYAELKTSVQTFYDTEMAKLASIDSLETIATLYKEIINDVTDFITTETAKALVALKNKALEELQAYLTVVISKIPDEGIRGRTQAKFDLLIAELTNVTAIDDIPTAVTNIKDELISFAVVEVREFFINSLSPLILSYVDKIPDADLKVSLNAFYTAEVNKIKDITDLDDVVTIGNNFAADIKNYVTSSLLPLAVSKLDTVINPLINAITHDGLKTSVTNFYNTEKAKILLVDSIEDIVDLFNEIKEDSIEFITSETAKVLVELKIKAIEEIDTYVQALIAKIPYDSLKNDVSTFVSKEKDELIEIKKLEDVELFVEQFKEDVEKFAFALVKDYVVAELDKVASAAIEQLPTKSLKDKFTAFKTEEFKRLNDVDELEDIPTTFGQIKAVLENFAKGLLENAIDEVKFYLNELTEIKNVSAFDYLPYGMNPRNAVNIVSEDEIAYDFTEDTPVSEINQAGYGEQWQMVVENINQCDQIGSVFNVAQATMKAAGDAASLVIDNYFGENISKEIGGEGKGFTGLFEYKDSVLRFNISINGSISIPGIGTVKPNIEMSYDLVKETKTMFISLGDAYKVKYVLSEDYYEMATVYGITIAGKPVNRSSFINISIEDDQTVGHIYEYTNAADITELASRADFYVKDGYVSVVGNKASGMLTFDNYINELYLADEGRLLGYEIREQKTILGITGTYHTLWFNLWDIQGINSVKVTKKTDANESVRSTADVYLNGSSTMLKPTYNEILIKKTSRKYDVESRCRYYYTYDSENNKYVSHEVQVPMMFIQEGNNYASFEEDILKDNGLELSVKLNKNYLDKILADYDTLIDAFAKNTEVVTSANIIEYLKY